MYMLNIYAYVMHKIKKKHKGSKIWLNKIWF